MTQIAYAASAIKNEVDSFAAAHAATHMGQCVCTRAKLPPPTTRRGVQRGAKKGMKVYCVRSALNVAVPVAADRTL
jgi:hypothetical protein